MIRGHRCSMGSLEQRMFRPVKRGEWRETESRVSEEGEEVFEEQEEEIPFSSFCFICFGSSR